MEPTHEQPLATSAKPSDGAQHPPAPGSRRNSLPLIVFLFLFLAGVVAILIGYDLRVAYRDTLAYWKLRLSNSTEERVKVVTLWLKERRTDAEVLAGRIPTALLLSTKGNHRGLEALREDVQGAIENTARINGFVGGAVADTECRIVAQAGVPAGAMEGVQGACLEVKEFGEFRIAASRMPQAHVWIDLAVPVFAAGGSAPLGQASRRQLGAVVMIAEPWESVYFPLISPASEPTRSTQTLLVWREEHGAVIFSPRLLMEGAEALLRRPLGVPAFESLAAREENLEFGEFTDYRGVRVFGAARLIGPGQGSLARKVDREEALAQFHQRERLEWLAGALSVLLFGVVMAAQRRHAAVRDLREQLKQQQALLDLKRHVEVSEERLRGLMEGVEAIVWEADAATLRPTFVSQSAEKVLGYPAEQWVGTQGFWKDHLHPEDCERALACERTVLEKGAPLTVEYRMMAADGQFLWFRDYMYAVPGPGGITERLRGIMVEVTESKRVELALQASEERYRAFIANSIDGIWRYEGGQPISTALPVEEQIEQALRFAYLAECNDALARQYGFDRAEEMIGRRLKDRISDDARNLDHLRTFIQSGYRLEDAETFGRDREGKLRYFINSYVGVVENGCLVRVWGVQRDITARKQLEQQFLQAQKMEAVGRLAGGVAHDFNNLLTVINGYARLLLKGCPSVDPIRAPLQEIVSAGERATGLIRQLLAFSRKEVLEPRLLDLGSEVEGMQEMLRRLIGEDVELRIARGSPLGLVKADPAHIEQLILNLTVNARDAMPHGGVLSIETANAELDENYARTHAGVTPGCYVMLAVTDTGIGMDSETMAHLFEPFFTTKEKGKGTGLGLSTVYGIVEQSEGHVMVSSVPGQGTAFKVYLPVVGGPAPAPREGDVATRPTGGSETILLAEDDPAVRALAAEVLREGGYTVLESADAQHAMEISEGLGKPIDLLLTDVIMPGMDGQDLAGRLALSHPTIKVLFMSGYTEGAFSNHGLLETGRAFLRKPFTPEILLRKVRDVLDVNRKAESG